MDHHFAGDNKLFALNDSTECLNAIRYMTSQAPKSMHWRDRHSYMVAEHLDFEPFQDKATGTLQVTGYIRGSGMSANSLVHLQNHGDFQIEKIVSCPLTERNGMTVDSRQVLDTPLPDQQESLVAENEIDPMEGEQTWPTDEEIQEAECNTLVHAHLVVNFQKGPQKKTKRVPKGTSAYQAAWILDSDEGSGHESFEEDEEHAFDEDAMMTDDHHPVDWNGMNLGTSVEHKDKEVYEESEEEYEEIELEDKEGAFDATVNPELEEKE